MVKRMLRHLFALPFVLRRCFPAALLAEIETAIRISEQRHSGEIRFAVETTLPVSALWQGVSARQSAIAAFSNMGVWDTQANSGVLIYLLLADHDLEIVADRGIAEKVSQAQWDEIAHIMEQHFRSGNFRQGALEGISKVTDLLAEHFPPGVRNANELSDKPVILKR
jgi:uncharacterized membrane protein